MKKLFILSAAILSFFVITNLALAQEPQETAPEDVKLDTTINPEDLGVKKANILPDSPFYGFKNMFRNLRFGFTLNPVKKAEYKLSVSNEKIIEAKQLIEERNTDKARQLASKTIEGANKDLEGIVLQGERLKQLKTSQAPAVNKFLDKVADYSLKQQVLLQKLGEQVPEESFVKIEEARQRHLEQFGQVMAKVSENPEEIRDRFSKVVEERAGSDFKELKAIEILRNLEDKVPSEAKGALRLAQERLGQNFEKRFLAAPEDTRDEKFSEYVKFLPGNPVRQFEALDRMKQSFQSAEAMTTLEVGKDSAVRKFENQFNQFSQDESRVNFMEPWLSGDPEDLRTMTEIQMRIEPPQQFQAFQQEAMENFKQKFNENPDTFKNDQYFQKMRENPDIVDLQFSRELNQFMENPFTKEIQEQTSQQFIDNIQPAKSGFDFGPPVPGGLKVLQELRQELPQKAQKGINQAIGVQTQMIQRHIQRTDDPVMFQKFEQQIEQNPEIKQEIQINRGADFFNQMKQRSRQMEKIQQQKFMPQAVPVQPAAPRMEGGVQIQPREFKQIEQFAPQQQMQPKLIEPSLAPQTERQPIIEQQKMQPQPIQQIQPPPPSVMPSEPTSMNFLRDISAAISEVLSGPR